MLTREHAKAILKAKGWSYRAAAPKLGVGYVHLSEVLNGHRKSRRILDEIPTLPASPTPYHETGFARKGAK